MNKIFKIGILGIFLSGVILLQPAVVLAGPLDAADTNLKSALGGTGLVGGNAEALPTMVGNVIKAILGTVGTLFLIFTVYAGILWMTAQGNEEQVTKATDIIKTAVIGLAITMSAYAITYFVAAKLGGVGGGGNGGGVPGAETPGGNSPSEFLDTKCITNLGGQCEPEVVNEDPCNPSGTDNYTGTNLGYCNAGSVCCQLDWGAPGSQGAGWGRCEHSGGSCKKGECAPGKANLGTCETRGFNQNCCAK